MSANRPIAALLAAFAAMMATIPMSSFPADKPPGVFSPSERFDLLARFIAARKFTPEGTYPGATNEQDRLKFEAWVNELAVRLQSLPVAEQTKSRVLAEFKPTLDRFEHADSEERDRLLGYLEDLMDVFGIASSDGMLNKWRYGFDPKESPESRNANAIAAMTTEERALLAKLDGMTSGSAQSVLVAVLGPASSSTGGMQIWYLKPDASSAISLMSQGGVLVWSWMAKDRFFYARRL